MSSHSPRISTVPDRIIAKTGVREQGSVANSFCQNPGTDEETNESPGSRVLHFRNNYIGDCTYKHNYCFEAEFTKSRE